MCGIAGFYCAAAGDPEERLAKAASMANALTRRGPDDAGALVADSGRLGLGFRRLAIIDLSAAGHQPMRSSSGSLIIVFNGEIYNYPQLRDQLTTEGHAPVWRGSSDTEVLLAAIEAWGLERALQRVEGMFALALWDERVRSLSLARDRFGEKPLYYGWHGPNLLFGSEPKALAAFPGFSGTIDPAAVTDFLRLGYVPAPASIFAGIFKLPPGSFATFDQKALASRSIPASETFWSARTSALTARATPFVGSDDEAIDALDAALRRAVSQRTFADVPVGAFLSGGIDSSLIVALMQALSSSPVHSFTIGNSDADLDESAFAAKMARHLGTRHENLNVSAEDAMAAIPTLADCYSEPFADSSQIPTRLVAALARRSVTVALTGDGGDELFGGYNRHVWGAKADRFAARLPKALRQLAGAALKAPSPQLWELLLRLAAPAMPAGLRGRTSATYPLALAAVLQGHDHAGLHDLLTSAWPPGAPNVLGPSLRQGPGAARAAKLDNLPLFRDLMLRDTDSYLPDDVLVKVDRATMYEGLEGRAPYLDSQLFTLAWQLPDHLLIRGGRGKIALRRVLARYVPEDLFERPKQGFAIPLGEWLRGGLADWAENLLAPDKTGAEGLLDPKAVSALWQAHRRGEGNAARALWNILMLQAWRERWKDSLGAANAVLPMSFYQDKAFYTMRTDALDRFGTEAGLTEIRSREAEPFWYAVGVCAP